MRYAPVATGVVPACFLVSQLLAVAFFLLSTLERHGWSSQGFFAFFFCGGSRPACRVLDVIIFPRPKIALSCRLFGIDCVGVWVFRALFFCSVSCSSACLFGMIKRKRVGLLTILPSFSFVQGIDPRRISRRYIAFREAFSLYVLARSLRPPPSPPCCLIAPCSH